MMVKCYECEEEVNSETAQLVPFSITDLMALNDELGSEDLLEGSEEIGNFYICSGCWNKLGTFIEATLKDLREGRG